MQFRTKDGSPRSPLALIENFDLHLSVFGELALSVDSGAMDPAKVYRSLLILAEDHEHLVQVAYEWARLHKKEPVDRLFSENRVVREQPEQVAP